ncbi:MAG: radical SAM protein [Candidatus Omnitrophota bacterium]
MNTNSLTLNLGSACNNNCIFCVRGDNVSVASVDFHAIRHTLNKFHSKYHFLKITGGEPTLHRDIVGILALAQELHYVVSMETNARMLADKEFSRSIAHFKPEIVTHLESHLPSKHDIMTRTPGSFMQTVTGIKQQVKHGVSVSVKIMILEYNYRDLLSISKLLVKLRVNRVLFVFLDPGGFARKFFRIISPRYNQVRPFLSTAVSWLQKNTSLAVQFENFPACCIEPEYIVLENQRMHQNDGFAVGTLPLRDQIALYVPSVERRKKKIKNAACLTCGYFDSCEGVYLEYIDHFGWEEFNPVLYPCKKVPVMI